MLKSTALRVRGVETLYNYTLEMFFFAEIFRSFFDETFWSLKHFDHLSHSYIKTHCNSVFWIIYIF